MFYDKEKISCLVDIQLNANFYSYNICIKRATKNLFIFRYKYNLRLNLRYQVFLFFVGQRNVQHKQLESDTLNGLDIYTWQNE